MRTLLAIALVLGAAAPARADTANEITMGAAFRALRSPSANALSGDNLTAAAWTLARDLGIRPVPRLALWATAGLSRGLIHGEMFRTITTEIDALTLTAGASARYTLHRHLTVSARLELGTARTEVELTGPMASRASDRRWGGAALAAASLDLIAITGPRFQLGFRAELGYTAMAAPALSARATGDGDLLLSATAASLGDLDLGGRFIGSSVIAQF